MPVDVPGEALCYQGLLFVHVLVVHLCLVCEVDHAVGIMRLVIIEACVFSSRCFLILWGWAIEDVLFIALFVALFIEFLLFDTLPFNVVCVCWEVDGVALGANSSNLSSFALHFSGSSNSSFSFEEGFLCA
jgi:hypothetical protein